MTINCEDVVRFGNIVIIFCVCIGHSSNENPSARTFPTYNFVSCHKSCTSEEVSYMHNKTCLCYAVCLFHIIMLKTSRYTISDGNN